MLFKNIKDLDEKGKKGDWAFMDSEDVDGLLVKEAYICLLWGDNSFLEMAILPIVEMKGRPKPWQWNGDKEKPTLTPSILVKTTLPNSGNQQVELWHGFLTDGKLVNA